MSISTYIKSHAVLAGTVGIVVVISMIIAGRVASRSGAVEATDNTRKVSLVDVNSFRGDATHIPADGTVESVSQADLKSQISAPISSVNVAIGDMIYTGQTIATLQNADIRAQLDQARASLVIAQGQYSSGGVSLDSARKNALDKAKEAYSKADDIIHSQIDAFLLNGAGTSIKLYPFIMDQKLSSQIRDVRFDLLFIFPEWDKAIRALPAQPTDTQVKNLVTLSQKNTEIIKSFLENISTALNKAALISTNDFLTTINGWQTITTAGRSSMNGVSAGLIAADAALSGAVLSQGASGSGAVSSAEAGVKNLEAQLAKTVISSPITGRIAALPLRTGELASPGQLIATVVGGGGLNIKAYVSGEDFSKLRAGAKALVQNTIAGTVTSVAPSLNQTNKKVEVKIAVNNPDTSGLVVGQNVSVSIDAAPDTTQTPASIASSYILPIQDVKIIPGSAFVFTVDENSKVVKHAVTLGKVDGGFVEVTSGIEADMKIVSPVYELEEGDQVTVR